ncbi:energy-coupling factor transporter transmembrane component T [Actinophytocola sp.]|uniref:energy-coupling factor transporter transmembrane component T family protein n=1 Tax=Actinophytocola sp. TaxID=1872138 RepID=UPI002D7F069F|nr:energy-coupling factor transporter transmembrane component T [Actinophytocola sp.]HET9143910.1 energy-coupling factor transporter transmembrane component T [Actinophytocola sp.]
MGAGHAHLLYRPGDSPVHRLPPQVKVLAALTAVICVVATPRTEFWAFGGYLAVLLAVWAVARVPVRWFAVRALIELPFALLALGMLVFGGTHGALAGWNILAKGTLGLLVSLTLAATTTPADLIVGLQRLRVPAMLTTVATLMLRYLAVIAAEARRMRVARIARGHNPRFLWQAGATARGIGALFVRSYERGERVHLAMVSRGFTGTMPDPDAGAVAGWTWIRGLVPTAAAAGILAVALWA